jgi:hypothetical protein
MEILLLIAVIASAASGLYVAVRFNTRATQNFTPLVNDAARDTAGKIEAVGGELRQHVQAIAGDVQGNRRLTARLETESRELRQQLQAITDELRRNTELARRLDTASGELRQLVEAIASELRLDGELATRLEAVNGELQQRVQAITDELRRDREQARQVGEQAGTRQAGFGRDLARLDHRVAGVSESLTEQSSRIAEIYRYVIRRETQAGGSSQGDLLLLAMLEAESFVDGKGWGGRPHLYALTMQTSTVAADHELADALVPVEQGPLPDGDLAEALAGIRWPADVVGCVLVTELAALPPGGDGDAPVDPLAAGQWASSHPDGRPARLTVGVRQGGGHMCGLRVKGDEMQVRNEMAGDLVAALLGTF